MIDMSDCVAILTLIVSVIAVVVALWISRKSSKDAQQQIGKIQELLDVFVAVQNLNISEVQKKYESELEKVNTEIEELEYDIVTAVTPFLGGALIDRIHEQENRSALKRELKGLMTKREEIEHNLSLIQNYIKKTQE